MIKHYISTYTDEAGRRCVEAWLQINLFGRCFCFSRQLIYLH